MEGQKERKRGSEGEVQDYKPETRVNGECFFPFANIPRANCKSACHANKAFSNWQWNLREGQNEGGRELERWVYARMNPSWGKKRNNANEKEGN